METVFTIASLAIKAINLYFDEKKKKHWKNLLLKMRKLFNSRNMNS